MLIFISTTVNDLLNNAISQAHSRPKLSNNDTLVNISNPYHNPCANLTILIHADVNMDTSGMKLILI